MGVSPERLEEFSATVWERGRELYRDLAQSERASGRQEPSVEEVRAILDELEREGFVMRRGDAWLCAE